MKNNKQTTLDLNGPNLSFGTQPVGVATTNGGSAIFTGIATATFNTIGIVTNTASNTGTIVYQWYDQNGAISNGTYVTGAATTTLTLSNLISPTDHKRQVYVIVDYIPSAYGQGPITAGTARSTGNAINKPIISNVGILTVFAALSITTQPIDTTAIENVSAVFNVVVTSSDTSQSIVSYQWSLDGIDLVDTSTVSGSNTPNLNISSSQVGISTVQVKINNSIASNSPIIYSNVANFGVIPSRKIINIEKYDTTSSIAELSSHNLLSDADGELTILSQYNTSATSLISLYASEQDINIEMDIYGGAGANSGSYTGGQGGYSRIRFTMKKNEEYTFAGLDIVNKCPFIYRKGSLIAVVGRGGDAASGGNGGNGGGINVVGSSGGGRGAGSGGSLVSAGTLSPNGVFGSASNLTPISPDTKATGQAGGRTIPCPKGNYWLSKGYSACSDVGTSEIYLGNGALVSNSASIARGFKSGYDIRQTAGKGQAQFTQQGPYASRTCYNTGGDSGYRIETRNVTYDTGVVTVNTSPGAETADLSWNQVRQPPSPYTGNVTGYFHIQRNFPNTDYRSYYIALTNERVKSPNGSVISISSMAAGGDTTTGGIVVRSLNRISTYIWEVFFQRNNNGLPTFTREFIFRVTGNEDFSVYYDDTYSDPYECGFYTTETVAGGGDGGAGATGGSGGTNSSGGGGGSGYTDGSVTVVSTQQGGSTGDAKVVLRVII